MDLSDPFNLITYLIILLFSVVFHEVAHGLMAYRLGDDTAEASGRLTLNPLTHIDLWGSIILPIMFYLSNLPILGSAKPVPVNYANIKNVRMGMILISAVGPLTNLVLALVAAMVYRLAPNMSSLGGQLVLETIYINLYLALFNLLPIPPLDGSKVLASIVGYFNMDWMYKILDFERFGFIVLYLILLIPNLFSSILIPPLDRIMSFLVGG